VTGQLPAADGGFNPKGRDRLRWSDLANLAGVLTLSRLPFALAFPWATGSRSTALALYIVAVSTDVLDGWAARRSGTASFTGSVLDGWLDKVLHVNAAWSFVVADWMPGWWMLCWFSREIVQAPMVIWLAGPFYRGEAPAHHATRVGKLTSVLLAVAIVGLLLGLRPLAAALTPLIGLLGFTAALQYLWRDVRAWRVRRLEAGPPAR
jgi:CDP-diacylglycerol--glycerol-3-phosphate 3-phosphatidyltransferase